MKKLFLLLAFNLTFLPLAMSFPPCGENKFLYGSREGMGKKGYVDVAKVFDDYKKTRDFHKYLESKNFKKQIEYDALKAKRGEDARALEDFKDHAQDPLIVQREAFTKEVLQDMWVEIKAFGKVNRYAFIMDDRCGKEGDDITSDIVAFMNKNYEESGKVQPDRPWSEN